MYSHSGGDSVVLGLVSPFPHRLGFCSPRQLGGQQRGDKEYPLSGVRNQFWQSLEEDAEKRSSECDSDPQPTDSIGRFTLIS